MKRKIFIPILFMAFFRIDAQNIVLNYSFEDTIKCPDAFFYFKGYVSNWSGLEPGYFSPYCNDGGLGGEPENTWGYQYPHSGNAYTGIYTFLDAGSDTSSPFYQDYHNSRDYIQDSLSNILNAGIKYYVTFYVSLGDSVKYACNNIGAYFSDSALLFPNARKVKSYLLPQIENDTSNHLTDKINWMRISGSFIAKGGEKYIVIGNFNTDAQSDTIFVNSSAHAENTWTESYYYIDDVIVTTDSNYADSLFPTSVQSISKPEEVVTLYPNPNNGEFIIEMQNVNQNTWIEVYNTMGERIRNQELTTESAQINLQYQPQGIYLYRLLTNMGRLIQSGKLIIQ